MFFSRFICSLLTACEILLSVYSPVFLHIEQPVHTATSRTKDTVLSDETESVFTASSDSMGLSCESALLMEASTGTVLYEKKATEQFRPASITKIMTLILIFDALAENKITLDDTVTVSEHASSMGGSQVYLEPGETQTVETMIKCISVASANDACVSFKYSRHYFS